MSRRRRRWPRLALIGLAAAAVNLGIILVLARLDGAATAPRPESPRTLTVAPVADAEPPPPSPADGAAEPPPDRADVRRPAVAPLPALPALPALPLVAPGGGDQRVPWPAIAGGERPPVVPALPDAAAEPADGGRAKPP